MVGINYAPYTQFFSKSLQPQKVAAYSCRGCSVQTKKVFTFFILFFDLYVFFWLGAVPFNRFYIYYLNCSQVVVNIQNFEILKEMIRYNIDEEEEETKLCYFNIKYHQALRLFIQFSNCELHNYVSLTKLSMQLKHQKSYYH